MDDILEFNDKDIETENAGGNVRISGDVIAAIAGVSAEETKGVAGMYTSLSGTIAEKLGSKKSLSRGVKVDVTEDGINLDLYIIINYGVRIRDVAESVQDSVKNNVETMTGMDVLSVDVHVEGVKFDKAPSQKDNDVQIVDEF